MEVIGGDGANLYGGGGGGGRIAIYHTGDNHWTGSFLTYGGLSYEHHGGSGELRVYYACTVLCTDVHVHVHVHTCSIAQTCLTSTCRVQSHAGTTYIEDRTAGGDPEHQTMILDNNGRTSSERFRGQEVVELLLSGPGESAWNSQSFRSYGGVEVSTTGAPYEYYDEHGHLHRQVHARLSTATRCCDSFFQFSEVTYM